MARSQRHRFCRGVVAQALFDIVIAIQWTDKRHGLRARAKSPIGGIRRKRGTKGVIGRVRQRRRVTRLAMLVVLRLVTASAHSASRVLARCDASQCEENNDDNYQISRPLNWI